MSGHDRVDPLVLRVPRLFYEFVLSSDAGTAFANGQSEDGNGEPIAAPLLDALRKIQATPPRHRDVRFVRGLTVAELDALAPYASALAYECVYTNGTRTRPYARPSQRLCEAIEELREIHARADAYAVSAHRFPMHARLQERQAEAATLTRFLAWLTTPASGVVLAERDPQRLGALRASTVKTSDLMLAFLGVDPAALAKETDRLGQARRSTTQT